ncbi:hypothetical protein CQW23_25723 [Capsicum baccatum]|uniref:F-box associated beta-propeller type 1 domain-containing protein n=1 Tax=Capsicum baccatum TaxID=33114 RepID=A0A2G2VLS7_CAPBA|nr:hypothetical protein CQW23_25723 [Capsicum baccatum]
MENPTIYTWTVGSVNGLICLYSKIEEVVLWNPTIKKSKKLPTFGEKLRRDCSYYCKYGFGYDESHDDYKVVVIQCISEDGGSYNTVVNIYSLKADSWRTINKFQGNFLINSPGKFVNGKLYWALSSDVNTFNMCNIISLDLADETWRMLELPASYGEASYPLTLGVMGSHLSVLCLNCHEQTYSDVWIMKDCGVKLSWTKIFTVDHPKGLGEFIFFSPIFSMPLSQTTKGEILLLLRPVIMIYDGSTRQLEIERGARTFMVWDAYHGQDPGSGRDRLVYYDSYMHRLCPLGAQNRNTSSLNMRCFRFRSTSSRASLVDQSFSRQTSNSVLNGPILEWKGSISAFRSQLISYIWSRKMISKGCVYHLVRVKDSSSKTPSLESVPVESEFSNVFPEDLLRVSPNREIDFGFDLLSDT